jgi:endonuclease/exonuclease/phosphatase family metal-dependent hydrolase
MAESIKLIQLNIEHEKHVDVLVPFLQTQQPDVVCLQEINLSTVPTIERALGAQSYFVPMARGVEREAAGIAIFSRWPLVKKQVFWYGGSTEELPLFNTTDFETKHNSVRFSLAVADIDIRGVEFRVGVTHFPVTDKGEVTDFQRQDLERLLSILATQGEIIFSGDFNAPRGGEIFGKLAAAYQDNVPLQYKTSIDIPRHRNGAVRPQELADKMVDGLFTTPGYQASQVRLQDGVSDHCAIVAHIAKQ